MSDSVDNRIVNMEFDNSTFERGASQSLSTLDRLKAALHFDNENKSLDGLQQTANRFSLASLAEAPAHVGAAFAAMATVGITAIANLTNRAIDAGLNIAKSLTLDPILDGYKEYKLNLDSIQTILANTKQSGENLKTVQHALDELNHYSDLTIYNFSEMAKNIGTFTAAGVGLNASVSAIKGIANLAALSGASSDQASRAMYQLSQALAAGVVHLQDWNSVVNAGIGGTQFQNALVRTAENLGTLDPKLVSLKGKMKNVSIAGQAFRNSLTPPPGGTSWLTSDVLTKTLAQFTGDLTDAQLAAQGYSADQIKLIQQTAKLAFQSATKVKNLSQLLDVARESVGSGWTKTWQIIFGNFHQSRGLFTRASNALNSMIMSFSDGRNNVLKDWADRGGRTKVVKGLIQLFKDLKRFLIPVKNAFKDIFPPTTGSTLLKLSQGFKDLMGNFRLNVKTMHNIRLIFDGLFSILHIGGMILGGVIHYFTSLIGLVGHGSGGILALAGSVGKLVTNLDKWLSSGDKIGSFFDAIIKARADVFGPILDAISALIASFGILITQGPQAFVASLSGVADAFNKAGEAIRSKVAEILGTVGDKLDPLLAKMGAFGAAISGFLHSFSANDASKSIEDIGNKLQPVVGVAGKLKNVWEQVVQAFKDGAGVFDKIGNVINTIFAYIGRALKAGFSHLNLTNIVAGFDIGFFGTIIYIVTKFFNGIANLVSGSGHIVKNIGGVFNQLQSNLQSLQTEIRANIILKIAEAIGILAVSAFLLSKVDPKRLAAASVAIVALMFGINRAMGSLVGSIGGNANPKAMLAKTAQIVALSGAMVAMATSILILSGAVAILGHMKTGVIEKGLVAVTAILGVITAATAILGKTGGGASILGAAAALGILAFALTAMAGVLKLYSKMDWSTIVSGGSKAALVVAGLGLAMRAFGAGAFGGAAALVLVSGALVILSKALKTLADIGLWDMIKAVGSLAIVIGLLAGAATEMDAAVPGALALAVLASSMLILAQAFKVMGSMSLWDIIKALLAMAGALTIFGVAATVLAPVVPVIDALGAAIALFGLGIAGIGVGIALFAAGMATLAVSGAAGFAVITAGILSFLGILPVMIQEFGASIHAIADLIGKEGPHFVAALVKLVASFLDGAITLIPKFGKVVSTMINTGLRVARNTIPNFIKTGVAIFLALLQGIDDNINKIVDVVLDIISHFIIAVSNNLEKIIQAGVTLILKFMHGVAQAIRDNDGKMVAAGADIGWAIVQGLLNGLKNGIKWVVDAAKNLAKSALNAAKHVLGIHSPSKEFEKIGHFVDKGFQNGIIGGLSDVRDAFSKLNGLIKDAMQKTNDIVKDKKDKLDELMKAKHKDQDAIDKAKAALKDAQALHDQAIAAHKRLTKGLKQQHDNLVDLGKQYDVVRDKLNAAKDALAKAKQDKEDFAASIKDQFDQLPDITPQTSVKSYEDDLQKQIDATNKFMTSLQALRDAGLSDESYQKLLSEGLDAQPLIDELQSGGGAAVAQFNTLNDQLAQAASVLGNEASMNLKQAGIDIAQGLVDGLQSQEDALSKQMRHIAHIIVKAIKDELGIKSPSKVFNELGQFTGQGFAKGLSSTHSMIEKQAQTIGEKSMKALQMSLSKVGESVQGEFDMSPTITPVLDLTRLAQDASKIGGLLDTSPLAARVSFSQAAGIAADRQAATDVASVTTPQTVSLSLEQTINAPKSPDPAEVWRNTKSALSQAKEALTNALR